MLERQKQQTVRQYQRTLQDARQRHDAWYEVSWPRPTRQQVESQESGLERAVSYLWLVWLILGLAGGFISLPHTLGTVLATVELPGAWAVLYGLAAFIGVELALIGVSLVSALKQAERSLEEGKQASLTGLLNRLADRLGLPARRNGRSLRFDLSHLPDRPPKTGTTLVGLLFLASLIFNLADTLKDVPLLSVYGQEIHLLSRLTAGLLGPGLLLLAGHRFAHEVVRAATRRQRADMVFQKRLQEWQTGLQDSWLGNQGRWLEAVDRPEPELRRDGEFDMAEAAPAPFQPHPNGNGRRLTTS